MTVLKRRLKEWLKRVTTQTPEELADRARRNLMRRMAAVNPRTYAGNFFIGRNDPCYCGNTYAGTQLRGRGGNFVRDEEGNIKEIPVKFKHCCISKHQGVEPGEVTPEHLKYINKQTTYYNKTGKVIA